MLDVASILWVSVILQCIAVLLALRLIPLTRSTLAWLVISSAFLLMALRRTISLLYAEGYLTSELWRGLTTETVALTISILIVVGVFLIRGVFLEQRRNVSEIKKLSLAIEQNPSGTLILDNEGHIEYANPAFLYLYTRTAKDVKGTLPDILNPEINATHMVDDIWSKLHRNTVWEGEFCYKELPQASKCRWEKACISTVLDEHNNTTHYVAILEDITKQKEQHEKLEFMAMHDTLTGLPNRVMFNQTLAQEIIKAGKHKQPLAVMLLDSNNFKEVNDTLGHSTGDNILKEIGTRLKTCVDSNAQVARMSGDEFLILLPNSTYLQSLDAVEKILANAKRPYIIDDRSFEIGVSIGIAMYPEDGEDHETLLMQADIAMHAAKSSARKFMRYHKEFDEKQQSILEIGSEIRKAVDTNELLLHFQPKINLKSNTVDGVEALLRWQHPEKGLLYPDNFISLAEQSSHILLITRWVIENSLKKLSEWRNAGHEISLSINISARDLLDPKLPGILQSAVKKYNIEAQRLTLEITESIIMMYSQQTVDTLNKITEMGVNFSIDDFGTGYSSLQHLKQLPVSELKIDKSFVMNMINNENDAVIVRSTIDLAHNLGLSVVAEGIEEQETLDILEILRCDHGQGFYFNHPLTEQELLKRLQ